jgi:hypothetical protein
LLANHHNNHEDLLLAILKTKKTKKMLQKRFDQNTEQRNRSVESGSPGTCHDAC